MTHSIIAERRKVNLSDISIDDELGVVTILGIRYSIELLVAMADGEINKWMKIIERGDGVISVIEASQELNEMFDQLKYNQLMAVHASARAH